MGLADRLREAVDSVSSSDVNTFRPASAPALPLPADSSITRWEYATDMISHNWFRSEDLPMDALNETLAERGAQGWELVEAKIDADLGTSRKGHVLIFKRPLA